MIPLGSVNENRSHIGTRVGVYRAKWVCLRCTWMMAAWSDSKVFKLIDFWGKEGIQEHLEGSKHNKHVYETILGTAEAGCSKNSRSVPH